ncbi:Clp protease ClpP [Alkalihalobacillus sp. LMS6]|uniref:head maturation protease, ClpP-related n=1 Tax=Alkalihalobacillus sp. LMS6 TaxID=2924034 RepID=UPI0020CFE9B9|nr:head maturation protease, ClpP-related [Alkalihalobacillus sp. LMS6]UTR05457.1 Clp protease ClpP [Alkalihalobacillus sp. LMS6]
MNKFLSVKNLTADSADIYFYGDIVSSEWGKWEDSDTAPEDVREQLKQVEGVQNLNIYINSGGGSVFAGLAIYNMLKRHQAYKKVYVDGMAASIASIIAMAGDEINVPSNAFLMIHKPWAMNIGNSNDMRKLADDLDSIESGLLNVYEENLADGVDMETVKQMVNAETWLNGKEAAEIFNLNVGEANAIAASASDMLKKYNKVPSSLPVESQGPTTPAHSIADEQQKEFENLLLELDLI